jgi:acetyl-CoA acetyltransferase
MSTAIVGVGTTEFALRLDASPLRLAAEAVAAALKDADLPPSAIDGLVVNTGNPRGVDYDTLAEALGLKVRYVLQTWGHGRFMTTCVQAAQLALAGDQATVIAVVYSAKQSGAKGFGGYEYAEAFTRELGGPHGELPHYGLTAPASGAAMALRLYMERYGATENQLAGVAINQRAHAGGNPKAIFQTPITERDYLDSPMIVDPLRRLDCAPPTDGAICLLISRTTDADRAIHVLGTQGIQAGRDEFIFGRPHLGVQQQRMSSFEPSDWDTAVYARAGVSRDEVQGFYTYDAFSPLVWFALERFGFCGAGEAPSFCDAKTIGPGGSLPVNTNGGLLSEGHLCGYNHVAEMVSQLRGEAGARQIPDVRVLQWGSGYGDSVILGR